MSTKNTSLLPKKRVFADNSSDSDDNESVTMVVQKSSTGSVAADGEPLVASNFIKSRSKKASKVWDYILKLGEDRCQCMNPLCNKIFEHRIFRHADRIEKHVYGKGCDVAYDASIGRTASVIPIVNSSSSIVEVADSIVAGPTTEITVSTHILDTSAGSPVGGMTVKLYKGTITNVKENWEPILEDASNGEGRVAFKFVPTAGAYKLVYFTEKFFRKTKKPCFYPKIEVMFNLTETTASSLHLPLLLSPFGYSTYKGSI